MQWEKNDTTGQVIAGGNGQGDRSNQLAGPTDVLVDYQTNDLIICDAYNGRVVRWSRHNETTQGETVVDNISCLGLFMDNQRFLYISDDETHAVRQFQIGDQNGVLVAGGNGKGDALNQLSNPFYIFVDREQTVYVSDNGNHRVIKWVKNAKEGIIVAGNQSSGNTTNQLWSPQGLYVDTFGTIYVSDERNHRVMRWPKGTKQGFVVAGGNGAGSKANQLDSPDGLWFDRYGNLYVMDSGNYRVQRFSIGQAR
ncbi:unnamed protein product [Rotaria sp. Silwood2]|nr:unnamed protein product [Rotaria sp. Silwood2]